MKFAVGSLVNARGREWTVLPESEDDFLVVRPLGGADDEIAGISTDIETVKPAGFPLPDHTHLGDYRSCRLLRDAVRLGFRSSAGPFRSFARIGVDPRPYQLVPLLMALKLDPVRLLIADDVGIGKTVEAALVARELLDRGEIQRLAVLCPPHLAEQWQAELFRKFHIEAQLVLSGTARSLERNCGPGDSIFDLHPYTVVSTDFIKAERRRNEFTRRCPEFVIVDEAHTCAYGEERGRQLRHELVRQLAEKNDRHMVFVTATPHSGNENAFRSLLGMLNPDFRNLPADLTGAAHEGHRRRVAAHFVQRRRADIKQYLDTKTLFPEREEAEEHYNLTPEYLKFFDRVVDYCRESVQETGMSRFRQRVRWWSALALLRALASSPAAAAATLRNRASVSEASDEREADDIGRRTVMDLSDQDAGESVDVAPGADADDDGTEESKNRRRLRDMARDAESLFGDKDAKLRKAIKLVGTLVKDGYNPIVFCRFIETAGYVADALRESLPKGVEVAAVTGLLTPPDREARVMALGLAERRVLVCTDCLSEGVNLQDRFDAVFHYDLSWNPTRHEQREGRVDRYGQPSKTVRVMTYYGVDNRVDGIVLEVLINKHRKIRTALGISVPVPVDSESVVEAVMEGLILREKAGRGRGDDQMFLSFYEPEKNRIFDAWEKAAEREKRSRTMFAQETIKFEEVAGELASVREAIGYGVDIESFARDVLTGHEAVVSSKGDTVHVDLSRSPRSLRDLLGVPDQFSARFELPVSEGIHHLNRTHPIIEGLARHVMDTAMDPQLASLARRCGVIASADVVRRAVLLLVRNRYQVLMRREGADFPLLAEDCALYGFEGSPDAARWLSEKDVERIYQCRPSANVLPDQARYHLDAVLNAAGAWQSAINELAKQRGQSLLEAHRRVRAASQQKNVSYQVEPKLPVDVLGIFVYLPDGD